MDVEKTVFNSNEYQESSWGRKGGWRVRLTNGNCEPTVLDNV
jgi:hypothetical protein